MHLRFIVNAHIFYGAKYTKQYVFDFNDLINYFCSMKKITLLLIITSALTLSAQLNYEGKNYFLQGANIPWRYCGADFGNHYQWGNLYDSTWYETTFADCKANKVNTIRFWVHVDGRATPEFNSNGFVTGFDSNFYSNMDDFLNRAKKHDLMVILCLWSFDMTKNFTSSAGQYAGMHADLITDTAKTNSYIKKALIPMVERYKNQCNLLAYEIINEPEWSMNISGGGNTTQTVTAKQMQRFVGMCADAIHWYSNKMVTVGSACLKWNSDKYSGTTPTDKNYWSDNEIKSGYPGSKSYLDFYQIHYYDWMSDTWIFDPFNLNYPLTYWQLDKPTIIGECPPKSSKYSNKKQLINAKKNNFSGVLFWSYGATDGIGNFIDFKNDIANYSDSLAGINLFSCPSVSSVNTIKNGIETLSIFPNPANETVTINIDKNTQSPVTISIHDINGKVVSTETITSEQNTIDVSHFNKGIYLVHIYSKSGRTTCKMVIQ